MPPLRAASRGQPPSFITHTIKLLLTLALASTRAAAVPPRPNAATCAWPYSSKAWKTRGVAQRSSGRYLEYGVHAGFNNQRIELYHGLLAARAMNRTLLLPPALRHGKVRHKYPEKLLRLFEVAAASAEARAEAASGLTAAASLAHLLDLAGVSDLVGETDLAAYGKHIMTAPASTLACDHHVWLFDATERHGGGMSYCLKENQTKCQRLTPASTPARDYELLRLPSLFAGSVVGGGPTAERIERATLTYAAPLRRAAAAFAPIKSYAAVHIRASDALEFGANGTVEQGRIARAFGVLLEDAAACNGSRVPSTVDLFVASNVQRARYENTTAFVAGVEALRAALGATDIRVRTLDAPPEAVAAAVASAASSPAEGAALASTADLTSHIDWLIAVAAPIGFGGLSGSTFSYEIVRARTLLGPPCE